MFFRALFIAGGIAVVIVVLSRIFRRASRENEEAFQRKVLRAAATFIKGKRPEADSGSILAALEAKVTRGESSPLLDGVLRVELEVEKRSPVECEARVHILYRVGDEVIRGRVEMDIVPWERLASDIRADFIKHAEGRKMYVILDTGDSARPA